MAGWFPLGVSATVSGWQTLPAGAGGFNQGMSIASDNTLVIRTDTYGAYKWNPSASAPNGQTGVWQPLFTALTMPSDYVNGGVCGGGGQGPAVGCYEIQVCFGNSNVMYAMFSNIETSGANNSTVFKSVNSGTTWTRTAFTSIANSSAPANEATYKEWGAKIAIDPNNSSKVYVGTKSNGLFLTTDGNSFSSVSTSLIPLATNPAGYTGMRISSANSNNIFIASHGNGVYKSGDGGTTFGKLTAGTGPTNVSWAVIDEATGNYWAVDNEADLWRWNGTTWAKLITGGVKGCAVDPAHSGHLVAWGDQYLNETSNSNATTPTWSGFTSGVSLSSTGDVTWIGGYGTPATLDGAGFFDQVRGDNTLYAVGDKGTYKTTPWTTGSLGSTAAWNVMSRGIEQLVGIDVVVPPNTGVPLVCGWDFGIRYMSSLTTYPANFKPSNLNFAATWSTDYAAADSSYRVVTLADGEYGIASSQRHSYSDDGGQTWTSFVSNMPLSTQGGTIAASTSTNWVFQDCSTRQMYYTLNGGTSWTAAAPNAHSGATQNAAGRWIAADRVNSGQFTAMLDSGASPGFYKTVNGGASWSGPSSASDVAGGGAQMKAVPGQANHLWLTSGAAGSYGGVGGVGGSLKYSSDAGVTWTAITNFAQSYSVGFGKVSVTYPNVFVVGWSKFASGSTVSCATGTNIAFALTGSPAHTILAGAPVVMDDASGRLMRGAVVSYAGGTLTVNIDTVLSGSGSSSTWKAFIWGIWMTTSGQTTAPIWQQIAAYPGNSLDVIQGISGDMGIVGRCYIAKGGSGYAYYNP